MSLYHIIKPSSNKFEMTTGKEKSLCLIVQKLDQGQSYIQDRHDKITKMVGIMILYIETQRRKLCNIILHKHCRDPCHDIWVSITY